jgi:CheY-like chemotaxis protein
VKILLVEDDLVDVMAVRRASADLELGQNIIHVGNGQEALDYLSNESQSFPHLIILDINMPIMDGVEFLQHKIKDDKISAIPTLVFTTSNAELDRHKCYNLNISGYMVKPIDYQEFKLMYKDLSSYWLRCETPIYNK